MMMQCGMVKQLATSLFHAVWYSYGLSRMKSDVAIETPQCVEELGLKSCLQQQKVDMYLHERKPIQEHFSLTYM